MIWSAKDGESFISHSLKPFYLMSEFCCTLSSIVTYVNVLSIRWKFLSPKVGDSGNSRSNTLLVYSMQLVLLLLRLLVNEGGLSLSCCLT